MVVYHLTENCQDEDRNINQMLPSFQGVSAKKGGQTVAKNKKGKKHKKKNFKKVVLTIVSIVEDVVAILIAIKTLLNL